MRQFKTSEIERFLRAVDKHLSEPFSLLIIGGSAALLAYGVQQVTRDIDTWGDDFRLIQDALDAARAETGLDIPVEHPGVQDGPYCFEERLQRVRIRGLKQLSIVVPEKHDLVLMKTVRGEEMDMQTAEAIKSGRGLDLNILSTRYFDEMDHVMGRPERIDLNFLALVGRLYGEEAHDNMRRRLKAKRHRDPS